MELFFQGIDWIKMIVGIFIIFKRGHFADFFKTRGTIAASAGPEFRTQRIWRK